MKTTENRGTSFGVVNSVNEIDVVGFRDSQPVADGVEANTGDKKERNGTNIEVGIPRTDWSIGIDDVKETVNGVTPAENLDEPLGTVSYSKGNFNASASMKGGGIEIFKIKVGFIVGVELGAKVNLTNPYQGSGSPPPSRYAEKDNLSTKPVFKERH